METPTKTWIDLGYVFLDKCLPVIIGIVAGLIPFVYTIRKRRLQLKNELIEQFSQFISHRKTNVIAMNWEQAYGRRCEMEYNKYQTLSTTELKDASKMAVERNSELNRQHQQLHEKAYDNLCITESKLRSLLSEVRDEYGNAIYLSVNSLLQKPLKQSDDNEWHSVRDFKALKGEDFNKAFHSLGKDLIPKVEELDNQLYEFEKELTAVLKPHWFFGMIHINLRRY